MALFTHLKHIFQTGQTFLGLEITDTSLKMAEIRQAPNKKPLLLQAVVEPLPPGTVEEGRIRNPLVLHQVLQQAVKLHDFRTAKVHFVIPSSVMMVRYLKLPNVPDKAMKKILDFEIKHSIHLPFEHPYYDFVNLSAEALGKHPKPVFSEKKKPFPADPAPAWKEAASADAGESHPFTAADSLFRDRETQEELGEEVPQADVLLAAAPGELVDEYAALLRDCGLKPVSADIKPLALHRMLAAAEPGLLQGTLLTVDINDGAADISIFHNGHLKITRNVLAVFPDFSQPKTGFDSDDTLFGSFLDPDADFQQACGDLTHELERLMNFYRYTLNNRTHEFHTAVLTGDLDRLQDISDYITGRLNQNVIRPDAGWLDIGAAPHPIPLHRIAVPVGLALRGTIG